MTIKKPGAIRIVAAALSFILLFSAAPPVAIAQEASIKMEESASPPKGVKQMAQEMQQKQEADKAAKEQAGAAGTAAADTAAQPPAEEKKPAPRYAGIFRILEPLTPAVTFKTGNVKISNASQAIGNPGSHALTKNMAGGYYLETESQDIGFLKGLTAKTQYNRQLRNSLSVNSMNEFAATVRGVESKYTRTVSRMGGSGGAQNVSDVRKLNFGYKTEKGMDLSWTMDQTISKASGASPSRSSNKKQTWAFVMPIRENGPKLTVGHTNQANRNMTSGDVTKVIQTDLKLDMPLNEQFDLNLAYQFLGNRNKPASAAGTENRKATRSIGATYKLADDTKLTYLFNSSNNRNFSTVTSSHDTTNRDMQLEWGVSPRAKLTAGNATTFDQSAGGKTAVRTATFSYDHKSLALLPGATSVNVRKQFTRSAGASNTNYTLGVNTPLSYLDGRLTASLGNTVSVQHTLASSQRAGNVNQTMTVTYKVTKQLSVSTNINRIKNTTATPDTISARSVNRVVTDIVTMDFGKRLSVFKPIENVKYSFSYNRNATRTEVPAFSRTLARVRKHAAGMVLKGAGWNGTYDFERAFSITGPGAAQRSHTHKLSATVEDVFGAQLTASWTGVRVKTGAQTSAILKLMKKAGEKTTYFFSYELLENRDNANATGNSRTRFMEMGAELSF